MSDTENSSSSQDEMLILLATDIHLGVYENDPVRMDDCFITFEEILQQAVKYQVDFILLGGDLFHQNKPTINCLNRCLDLLRRYCFGSKPIAIEILNDMENVLTHPLINYLDPNLNISIPTFSINGNHDDPTGLNQTSAMDLVSAPGYINYFGKWSDLSKVNIYPICLRKGSTYLALYGISHIKDERFSRLFMQGEVTFYKPDKDQEKFFNLFVLHQNRVKRPDIKYIREDFIPDFMDFVFWGHEHECKITPEKNEKQDFVVLQLGSPVATSICPSEAVKKHVAILKVVGRNSYLTPIPLETVRPMVLKTINATDYDEQLELYLDVEINPKLRVLAKELLEELAEDAKKLLTGHPKQPTLPTVRLIIEFDNRINNLLNPSRFGQELREILANPADCLKYKNKIKQRVLMPLDSDAIINVLEKDPNEINDVATLLSDYFKNISKEENKLTIFPIEKINETLNQFVEKEENNSFNDYFGNFVKKLETKMAESEVTNKNLIEQLVMEKAQGLHPLDLKDLFTPSSSHTSSLPSSSKAVVISSDSDNDDIEIVQENKGRGKGRGKRGSTTTTRARGRGRNKTISSFFTE